MKWQIWGYNHGEIRKALGDLERLKQDYEQAYIEYEWPIERRSETVDSTRVYKRVYKRDSKRDSRSAQRDKKRFSRIAFYTSVLFDHLLASDNLTRAARRCVISRTRPKENYFELSLELRL